MISKCVSGSRKVFPLLSLINSDIFSWISPYMCYRYRTALVRDEVLQEAKERMWWSGNCNDSQLKCPQITVLVKIAWVGMPVISDLRRLTPIFLLQKLIFRILERRDFNPFSESHLFLIPTPEIAPMPPGPSPSQPRSSFFCLMLPPHPAWG